MSNFPEKYAIHQNPPVLQILQNFKKNVKK